MLEKLRDAHVHELPFPHLYVENVLPTEIYYQLHKYFFVENRGLSPTLHTEHKGRWFATGEFPKDLFSFWDLESVQTLLQKLHTKMPPKARQGWLASIDEPGYQLRPHIDDSKQLISLIFYMSTEPQVGTTLYAPKQPIKVTPDHRHFDFSHFDEVKTIPFKRNSCLGFAWSSNAWHGVKPVTTHRNTITWVLKC